MTDEFELPETVKTALEPETFDVLGFVEGSSTPVDEVVIYTNGEAGYELAKLREREKALANKANDDLVGITDEQDWVDADRIDELEDLVAATSLTVKLKGLAPAAKKAIRARLVAEHNFKESEPAEDQTAFFEEYTFTLIAKTISSVIKGNAIDAHTWTPEQVSKLRESLNESEFQKLDNAVYKLNFETDIFDRAVSADFLSKR